MFLFILFVLTISGGMYEKEICFRNKYRDLMWMYN